MRRYDYSKREDEQGAIAVNVIVSFQKAYIRHLFMCHKFILLYVMILSILSVFDVYISKIVGLSSILYLSPSTFFCKYISTINVKSVFHTFGLYSRVFRFL